ncbi:TPA: hypothetical protein DEP96_01850 [Candidatus Uhrbacteria bacterium]|nr:hypothetical protein [Candidatus Uhrbacteria bacterium]
MIFKKADLVVLAVILVVIAGLGALFFAAPTAPVGLGYVPVDVPGSTLAITPGASWANMQLFTVNLGKGGFITIHDAIGSAPGPIIATSGYLDPGLHDGTGVRLNTPLDPTKSYIALLHVDNGDQLFNVTDDLPVSVDGTVLRVDFQSDVAVSP